MSSQKPMALSTRETATEVGNVSRNRTIVDRMLNRSTSTQAPAHLQLEEMIDVDADITLFSNNQINLLNPRQLYRTGNFQVNSGLFRHYREIQVSCIDNVVDLPLIAETAFKEVQHKFSLIHLGLIVIAIKGLGRKHLGTKTLLSIVDTRWSDPRRGMIGITEIDMNQNGGIFYCAPDFLMTLRDFKNFIKISVQTKGYDDFVGENLLICVGFLGRCTNTSSTKFKLKIDDTVNLMGNKGIKLIKPLKFSSELLAGLDWNLSKNKNNTILRPEQTIMFVNQNNEVTIRFQEYQPVANPESEQSTPPSENDLMDREIVLPKDPILYPKELQLRLSEKELLKLETGLILDKTITDSTYLYVDNEGNIRKGTFLKENEFALAQEYLLELNLNSNLYSVFEEGESNL